MSGSHILLISKGHEGTLNNQEEKQRESGVQKNNKKTQVEYGWQENVILISQTFFSLWMI